jgi:hypothetical protein
VLWNIYPVESQIFPGDILVVDANASTGGLGALFRVDPYNGERTLFSDFGVGANKGEQPVGVAVEASGNILITDYWAGTNNRGALFRIDPSTFAVRTLLSDFGFGVNQGSSIFGVAIYTGPPTYPPVGGVITSVNKLEILIPYIALAGLIIAVSTVYIIKRRKD